MMRRDAVNHPKGESVQLLILRHAKSSWADTHADDWERPLTDRGVRNATSVGQLLRRLSLVPDLIITSDAVRAQTTAQIVAEAAGYTGKIVQSSALYHATPDAVIEVLRTVPGTEVRSVMIVGHNPGLENLVSQFTGEQVDLPTAALVQLALRIDRWSDLETSTNAEAIDSWTPADL
jgi:phosphohistidine phosphatase